MLRRKEKRSGGEKEKIPVAASGANRICGSAKRYRSRSQSKMWMPERIGDKPEVSLPQAFTNTNVPHSDSTFHSNVTSPFSSLPLIPAYCVLVWPFRSHQCINWHHHPTGILCGCQPSCWTCTERNSSVLHSYQVDRIDHRYMVYRSPVSHTDLFLGFTPLVGVIRYFPAHTQISDLFLELSPESLCQFSTSCAVA